MRRRTPQILPLIAAFFVLLSMPALASAHSVKWNNGVRIEPTANGGLTAISCASATLCVAGDQSGRVLETTAPTGKSWRGPWLVDKYGGITGISCPTTTFCVAVDNNGVLVSSTDPTGGPTAWSHPERIDNTTFPGGGYVGFNSISCPTTTLCVATDASPRGAIWYSTDPTGGPSAWHSTTESGPVNSVACASTALCVAVGSERYTSTTPSSGTSWKAAGPLTGAVYSSVACQTLTLCVTVGYGNSGVAFSSGTRTPTTTWGPQIVVGGQVPNPGQGVLDSVACTEGTCVTVDSGLNYWATSGIVNGSWNGGLPIRVSPSHTFSSISCKDLVCVVVDSAGVETTGVL